MGLTRRGVRVGRRSPFEMGDCRALGGGLARRLVVM